jgi:2-C-methyl-D-erythritol 2,4-cyclodiphosphate synthase
VAHLLAIAPDCVGLKAKTPEGLNLESTAIAHAVVLLERSKTPKKPQSKIKTKIKTKTRKRKTK